MKTFNLELLGPDKQNWTVNGYAHIGSDSKCQINLISQHVAERHARLEIKDNYLLIKDLKTEIGIKINGVRVTEAILQDGDIISIDSQDFVVHDLTITKSVFPMKSKCDYWNGQLQMLADVATSDYTILLLGPSGTGKDLIAQSVHDFSKKNQQPFISVNCSALTESLVESELFGHTKGSFTGATSDRKGAFETARNGTLFLDEIGELSYNLQAKLLRALENNEIRPVGSDRIIKTNVRVIAATHQNLYHKIREGLFRADLFYRLNVITIEVPALKDRLDDFDDLIYLFAKKLKVRFSFNAIQALKKHDWPGNIRELKNVVTRASVLFPKQYIEEKHIHLLLNKKEKIAHLQTGVTYSDTNAAKELPVIKEIEKQMIIKRLAVNNGSQKLTANDLGIPKSTLHDRIKTYKINPDSFKTL